MRVLGCVKLFSTNFINLFSARYEAKDGTNHNWMFASRKKEANGSKAVDAIIIVPFVNDKIVLLKQYRVPVGGYIYEFPAGLVDKDETPFDAGKRELKEETGLDFISGEIFTNDMYNSCGLTDEIINIMFVKAEGEVTTQYTEDSEDIEVLVLTKEEAEKLLKDRDANFSAKCWLILKAFINGYKWI